MDKKKLKTQTITWVVKFPSQYAAVPRNEVNFKNYFNK